MLILPFWALVRKTFLLENQRAKLGRTMDFLLAFYNKQSAFINV